MPEQDTEGPKKFDVVFRGYARGPVDEYVARLHEWLLDSEARADHAVEAAASAVGERVNDILRAALEAGEQSRQSAEKDGAKLLAQAEERANEVLRFAERRAEQLGKQAEAGLRKAEKAKEDAVRRGDAEVKRRVEEARAEIEALHRTISDLEERKDRALDDLSRLQLYLAKAPEVDEDDAQEPSGTEAEASVASENGDRPVPSSSAG